ncbi:MAG: penicillin acylase family protein, partial [Terriglobales bacterium]
EVLVTRHGPLVSELVPGEARRLALQWTLYNPGAMAAPFYAINSATGWQQFRTALSRFGGPSQNVVYADVDGHIGYQATGLIPIRKTGDGTVPVPGHDGAHDWIGFVPFDRLPSILDPPSGILATANGRITPDDYPFLLSRNWGSPYRTARILEVLESGRKFTREDMLALQMDLDSVFDHMLAELLLTAVEEVGAVSPRAQQAADLIGEWDGRITSESAAALILSRTRQELQRLLLRPKLGNLADRYRWFMSSVALENIVGSRLARWLPLEFPTYDHLLVAALEAAVKEPEAPPQLAGWQFGKTNTLEITHPLFGRFPLLRRMTGTGAVAQSGNGFTVKQVGRSFGPSERLTVDLSNLDASTLNIVNGQSGQILSLHYMDQWAAWLEGRTFPLPFSSTAVARARRHELILQPQGTK